MAATDTLPQAVQSVMADSKFDTSYEHCPLVPELPDIFYKSFPHFIEINSVTESNAEDLDIQDVIVTILYLHNPSFLAEFLNLDNLTASYYHKHENARTGLMDILIVRDGDMVECGFYEEIDEYKHWDCRVIYTILPHGEWIPEYAYSAGQHYFDDGNIKDIAASLGYAMLLNKPWVAGKGVKITHYFED